MLNKIVDFVAVARSRDAELKATWARGDAFRRDREGIEGVLLDAAEKAECKIYARECAENVIDYCRGKINRQTFEERAKLLQHAADTVRPLPCTKCVEGWITDGGLKRCSCLLGQRKDERALGPARQDGARELVIIPTINATF